MIKMMLGGIIVGSYKKNIYKYLAVVVFIVSVSAGFLWGTGFTSPPDPKPEAVFRSPSSYFKPKVTADTLLIRDKEYLCGDLEKISEEKAPDELLGMEIKDLKEKFPAEEGWSVHFTQTGFLTLTAKVDEFCPIHNKYRHLGLYNEMVAVYEGPLGYNGKILRVENIPLESLDPDFRIKLEQAMEFNKQVRAVAEELRNVLEYDNDDSLNAALENLDEHS